MGPPRRLRLAAIVASSIAATFLAILPIEAGAFAPLVINQAVPPPSDAMTGLSAFGSVTAISCPAWNYCVGFGYFGRTGDLDGMFRSEFIDGRWEHPVHVVFPPALESIYGNDAFTVSLSCASVGTCLLAGAATTDGLDYRPITMREVGGIWGPLHALTVATGVTTELLTGVSCPTTTWCEASGWYTDPSGTWAFTRNVVDGVWSAVTSFASPLAPSSQEDGFNSVSCWAVGGCAAVGWDTYLEIATSEPTFAGTAIGVVSTSGTWGPVTSIRAPLGVAGDVPQELVSVSCTDVGKCEAVGEEVPVVVAPIPAEQPTVVALLGGSWDRLSFLSYPGPLEGGGNIEQVSCFNNSACMAVGYYSNTQGMVFSGMVGGPLAESNLPQPSPPVIQYPLVVSCPTAQICNVGGVQQDSLALPELAESWSPALLTFPVSFLALHVGTHDVTLGWKAPKFKGTGIVGYDVLRVTKKGLSTIGFVARRTYDVSGLKSAHRYTFAVEAVSKDKQTSAPAKLTVTTK
jgi:hypothetical protein